MTVEDKSVFKGLYQVLHNKAEEEKADCYLKLMKLPEGISAREIAKIEKTIILCDKFQSFLYYRGMNMEMPVELKVTYAAEIEKRDKIIGWCI